MKRVIAIVLGLSLFSSAQAVGGVLAAPVISNVQAGSIVLSGAQISWDTDVPASSRVWYDVTSSALGSFTTNSCSTNILNTRHCFYLTGLAYNTVYYFRVESTDASGQKTYSAEYKFTSDNPTISSNSGTSSDSSGADANSGNNIINPVLPPSGTTPPPSPPPAAITPPAAVPPALAPPPPAFGSKIASGNIYFVDGSAITDAEIGAYSLATQKWISAKVDKNGAFSLVLGPGKWKLSARPIRPRQAKWSFSGKYIEVVFSSDNIAENQSANFVIINTNSEIRVYTVDENYQPLANAAVVIDENSAAASQPNSQKPSAFRYSDSSGVTVFSLAPGNYYLRASLAPGLGYFNPAEQTISLSPGSAKTATLIFKRPSAASAITLVGAVKLADGTPTDAFVWAWSEKGGYTQGRADSSGSFTMQISPNERWHVSSARSRGQISHKADEIIVDTGAADQFVEIILVEDLQRPLPLPVSAVQPATQEIVVGSADGAEVTIPPDALSSSGNISVEIASTVEAPSQGPAQVVSTVYEVTVKDSSGTKLTELAAEAEIILPYDEAELAAQGISENDLVPSFFDEAAGVWVNVDNYTIDKEKNIVIARVKHFTRFALVAPADVTPPAPPSALAVVNTAGGAKLSWQNPAKDFNHAKVYRSEQAGNLGKIAAAQVLGMEFSDSTVTKGATYYYTVRAVDPAGNESNNTNQVSIVSITSPAPAPMAPPPSGTAVFSSRPDGSLVKYASSPTVYLLESGVKRGLPSFELYKHYFASRPIITISPSELYPDGQSVKFGPGALLKTPGGGAVYLILDDGSRYGFTSAEEFKRFGFRFELVETVSVPELAAYPESGVKVLSYHAAGNFIKYPDSATVYKIENKTKRGITSLPVLEAHVSSSQIITVPRSFSYSDGPILIFPDGILLKGSGPAVYLITQGKKKTFPSFEKFTSYGYTPAMIKTASDAELLFLPDDGPIQ